MITRDPRDTPDDRDRSAIVRDTVRQAQGVKLFTVVDQGDQTRRGSTFELWVVRGRFLLVHELSDRRGIDVFYPSAAFQMNQLVAELRGYIAQGWDALRAGGSFR